MIDDNDDNNWWQQHCSFPIPDPNPTHSLLSEPHRPDWRRWEPHSQEVVPLPAACCSLHLVTRPLYLQAAGKMPFRQWHFFLLGCQKQKLFKYQSWNTWIREKQCCMCGWRDAGLTQAGFSNWEGQGNLRTLDKHSSWFHCDDCSCLLVIYSTRILNRTDLACKKVATRKVWNNPTHESWEGENQSHVRLITTDYIKHMADFPVMSINHLCYHCCCIQTATSLCKIKEIKIGTLSSSVMSNFRPHGL